LVAQKYAEIDKYAKQKYLCQPPPKKCQIKKIWHKNMPVGNTVHQGHHAFRPTIFFGRHFEQRECSLPFLLFVWHTVFNNLFPMFIHSRAVLSDRL